MRSGRPADRGGEGRQLQCAYQVNGGRELDVGSDEGDDEEWDPELSRIALKRRLGAHLQFCDTPCRFCGGDMDKWGDHALLSRQERTQPQA